MLCGHFATHGVARALSTMLQSLPTRADLQAMGVGSSSGAGGAAGPGGAGGGDELDGYGSMMDVPDIIKRTQAAGRELLRRYVYVHGCRLGALIRRAMTTSDDAAWLASHEPREVRLVVQLLLEDVAATRKLVASTLGDWDAPAAAVHAKHIGLGTALTSGGDCSSAAGGDDVSAGSSSAASALAAFRPGAGASSSSISARRTGMVVGASGVSAAYGSLGGSGMTSGGFGGRGGFGAMDIDRLFNKGGDGSPGGPLASGPGGGGAFGGGPGGALNSISSSKLVLGYIDYSPESVACGLLKMAFKSLVEWTRGVTLGTGGYQQLQADVAALHLALPFLVNRPQAAAAGLQAAAASAGGGQTSTLMGSSSSASSFDPYAVAGPLEELLNEAAVSAGERCVEPRPLDVSIVYSLAMAKLAQMNVNI